MKRFALIASLLAFLLPGTRAQDRNPVRHALVVTIGQYPPESGFRPINADNDRAVITKLLKKQGFTDTTVLSNSAATKEAFTDAFGALCSRVQPGDFVYLHFSSHGQQIEDRDGDETDGLDEAIAMCDARSTCTADYHGQNHLTDDELGRMLGKLRSELGEKGDILVTIDACHSGSMTRGADTAILRGGYPPLVIDRTTGQSEGTRLKGNAAPGNSHGKDHNDLFGPDPGSKSGHLANVVILSACENDEVSSEYYYNHRFYGPLTWAFLNAVLNNTRQDVTYTKIFHDITSEMNGMFENYATHQHPTIETSDEKGADKVIFGGGTVGQKPFYTVDEALSRDTLRIEGGTMTGLFEGTTVKVCPSGTVDAAHAGVNCTGGTVVRAGCLESIVHLDTPLEATQAVNRWVFIAERKLGGFSVSLAMGAFSDEGLKKRATTLITGSGIARFVRENPTFVIEQQKNASGLMVLRYARSRKVFRNQVGPDNLENTLLTAARIQFLEQLQSSAPGLEMEISLTSAGRAAGDGQSGSLTLDRVRAGADTAWLTIRNSGTKEFCFNLLEIDPDDRLAVLLPSEEVPGSECCLKPGAKFRKR
ncbi:MAG TPA: caspase family protein, partial [Bacteroidales bacterium]|nr:caspase family protein [Bacteroidales bacterium]